jgi:zinc D-Ala-D-Ala carboxypeptidase
MKTYFSPKEVGICAEMTWEQIDAMQDLIIHVLNPLRVWYKKPITINSGFRTVEHNAAIGGAPNSQHLRGEACDIDTVGDNKELFEYIKDNLTFDQVIWEQNGKWIHVSFTTTRTNRKQVLSL